MRHHPQCRWPENDHNVCFPLGCTPEARGGEPEARAVATLVSVYEAVERHHAKHHETDAEYNDLSTAVAEFIRDYTFPALAPSSPEWKDCPTCGLKVTELIDPVSPPEGEPVSDEVLTKAIRDIRGMIDTTQDMIDSCKKQREEK